MISCGKKKVDPVQEKEKQEQKQKEVNEKHQKSLLFKILNFFKKKQRSNT